MSDQLLPPGAAYVVPHIKEGPNGAIPTEPDRIEYDEIDTPFQEDA